MKCIFCKVDYPEEELQLYKEKNVCSSCILELLRMDLVGGLDKEKVKEVLDEYD